MTFVIKEKIETKCSLQKGNIFDIEPYNYIFNKKTIFLDSDIVTEDPEALQHVMENLKNLDIQYLDLLAYAISYETEFTEEES